VKTFSSDILSLLTDPTISSANNFPLVVALHAWNPTSPSGMSLSKVPCLAPIVWRGLTSVALVAAA
jgi:hypothetical protein